jgi:hypothetical protein
MKQTETHESYGIIGVSRVTGTTQSLFGSSITHNNTIRLRIKRARKNRELNKDWYFAGESLIEVEMSPTQFAEMITSLNVGDGVPCTLRYLNGHNRISDPPEVKSRQIFEAEFIESIKEIESAIINDFAEVESILTKKGNITAKEKSTALNHSIRLMRILTDHIPFIQKQFNRAMDKTVSEAKGEVEAFVMNKVTSLGIEAMKMEIEQPKLLDVTEIKDHS